MPLCLIHLPLVVGQQHRRREYQVSGSYDLFCLSLVPYHRGLAYSLCQSTAALPHWVQHPPNLNYAAYLPQNPRLPRSLPSHRAGVPLFLHLPPPLFSFPNISACSRAAV